MPTKSLTRQTTLKSSHITFRTKTSCIELWITGWIETFKKPNSTPGLGPLCNAWQCLMWSTVCVLSQDWVWVNTFAARNYKFTPGDIVVYVSPKDSTDCLIKRVIGVEGDIISSDRCVLSSQDEIDPQLHCHICLVTALEMCDRRKSTPPPTPFSQF